jgi:hypothetical protein
MMQANCDTRPDYYEMHSNGAGMLKLDYLQIRLGFTNNSQSIKLTLHQRPAGLLLAFPLDETI